MEAENMNSIPKRNIPRDLFLHLLAIVTLYWSSISFVTLLWQFINNYFPDTLNYYYGGDSFGLIRFSVSALIIVFPVFIAVSWYLNKVYRRESAVRESKIRKWLIYLTLFVTSLVIMGDLVTVVYNLLSGDTTVRFILKALSILFVAGLVFGYYLNDVKKDEPTKLARYFAWVTGVLVLVVVVCAFFIIKSPGTARLVQFDQQKVSDLQNIQYQVVNYWQRKGALPNSLSDLKDPISGYVTPTDMQTKSNYEYQITSPIKLSFELCATFNKQANQFLPPNAPAAVPFGGVTENWQHGAGRTCFERTIDKQLYPPLNPIK